MDENKTEIRFVIDEKEQSQTSRWKIAMVQNIICHLGLGTSRSHESREEKMKMKKIVNGFKLTFK